MLAMVIALNKFVCQNVLAIPQTPHPRCSKILVRTRKCPVVIVFSFFSNGQNKGNKG